MIKTSRRVLAVAGVLALAALAPRSSMAVSISKSTTTAAITFTGTGQQTMSILVKTFNGIAANPATDVVVSTLTFPFTTDVSGSLPITGWQKSLQYIEMTSVLTQSGSGIQIYTDNKAADAAPFDLTGIKASSSAIAGLVERVGTTTNPKVLPMAWTVRDLAYGSSSAFAVANFDPNNDKLGPPIPAPGFQGWHFFKDRSALDNTTTTPDNEAFIDGEGFIRVKDGLGIHFGPGPDDVAGVASPDYIALEADFSLAVTPAAYQARVRMEVFNL